jgi:hypothetical protein
MSRSSRTVRLLIACVLVLGLLPQGFGWSGTARASVIPSSDGGSSGGSVTMAVYQVDDTSNTVTSVVYSNPQGDLVYSTLTGHLDVYIQSANTVSTQDVMVDPRFTFTQEQLSANVVVLRDFQDTYSSGSYRTLINVNQGGAIKQLFLAQMNSGDSLFKFAASEQGVPQTIRSYTLTNLDTHSSYFYPDTLLSDSGSLYMVLPYGAYSMQLNAGPSGTASYVRAYRVNQIVDSATEGKLTVIPLNADERSWSAVKVKISAFDESSFVGADQVVRLKRTFYPGDFTEPYTFGSEFEKSTQPPGTSYSPDYATPITYYMDKGAVTSYELVAQIDRQFPDTSRYESLLAYSGQVSATPGTLFDWQISTANLSKLAMNYKPTVASSNPIPTSLSACLNYMPTESYSPLFCYPDFGISGPPTSFGGGYQMSLPIGTSGNTPGLMNVYVPKNFAVNSFFYMVTSNDGGSNYSTMTFLKSGEEIANLLKNADNDPAGATIDVGGKLSDIRTEYIADSRTVTAYLVNESGDRLINADNYNNESSVFPANMHYELVENPGASETKYQLYGMYPQQTLSSNVRLENVQIRFLGFERNGAALNYDILAKPASASSPWVTNFPIIVSLTSNTALNVPPGQFIYAVSDSNQVRIFGIDSLGQSAIGNLPAGHWQFRTLQANEGLVTNFTDFYNITSSFIQVGKASADWPVAASGNVVSLPVAVLSRDSGHPRPLDIADIVAFAKKIGTGTAWDINQDGQPLDKSDIQYLLQSVKHRYFSSPTGNTAATLNQ